MKVVNIDKIREVCENNFIKGQLLRKMGIFAYVGGLVHFLVTRLEILSYPQNYAVFTLSFFLFTTTKSVAISHDSLQHLNTHFSHFLNLFFGLQVGKF